MAIWLLQGGLGSGKTKYAVRQVQEYLAQGKRVATNVDLVMGKLTDSQSRKTVVRLPDYPTTMDLRALGSGNPDSYDESKNGLLLLDELAKWLNARDFQDKRRKGVIDFLIESRKSGWDVMFIAQAGLQIDRQIREALFEYICSFLKADKFSIPFGIGILVRTLSGGRYTGRLPRFHIMSMKHAKHGQDGLILDRDFFRWDYLHAAYDTRQKFADWSDPDADQELVRDRVAMHSLLPAWHLSRHEAVRQAWQKRAQERAANLARAKYPSLARLPPAVAWRLAKAKAEGQALPRPGELLRLL